jgi:hypothetical protein
MIREFKVVLFPAKLPGTARELKTVSDLRVKVVPGSSRNEIAGWLGDAVKIRVKAPPEKGKANAAVLDLLARQLGLSTTALAIISGHSSPSKIVAISGMDDEAIRKAIG